MKNKFLKSLDKNEKLFFDSSWKWNWNDSKKEEDYHYLIFELECLGDDFCLSEDLNTHLRKLINFKIIYKNKYSDLYLETHSIYNGREYDSKYYLIGIRLETDQERYSRIEAIKKERIENELEQKLKNSEKEQKDYNEYLMLKKRFEKL